MSLRFLPNNDCVIAYLDSFKKVCRDYQIIPVTEYTRNLHAYGQGPLRDVSAELQDHKVKDFSKFEQFLQACFALTPELVCKTFRQPLKDQKEMYVQVHRHMLRFLELRTEWLGVTTTQQWKDMVAMEQFLSLLPADMRTVF